MNSMKKFEELLQHRFGLGFHCESKREDGYPLVQIRPVDLSSPHGFSVAIKFSWKSLTLSLLPDSFSGDLIRDMGRADHGQRAAAGSFAVALAKRSGTLTFKVNGDSVDPGNSGAWPEGWSSIELRYERLGFEPNLDELFDGGSELSKICMGYIGIIVSVLPVEKGAYEESLEGLPEGMLSREEFNRYERNRLNREACIAIKGTSCLVCGFNFADTFGDLGEGFIHVHHVVPVSQTGGGYVVDPSKDLVPVCATCHSMMHRTNPPLGVDELREILEQQS